MATSCTDFGHPFYNQKFGGREYLNFFMKNPEKMKYVSLGEFLDFMSFGGMNFVGYDFGTRELIEITQKWMEAQPKKTIKVIWKDIGHGTQQYVRRIEKAVHLWNRPEYNYIEKLPKINYSECPRDKNHKRIGKDLNGRIRCFHVDKKMLRPSFIEEGIEYLDPFSGTVKTGIFDDSPFDPTPDVWEDEEGNYLDYSEEHDEYLAKLEEYDNEKPTLEVRETCYATIKEPSKLYIPLETVLDRLNCYLGKENFTVHPFPGFTLANYIRAWYNQKGKKQFFEKDKAYACYRAFPKFQPISSDD